MKKLVLRVVKCRTIEGNKLPRSADSIPSSTAIVLLGSNSLTNLLNICSSSVNRLGKSRTKALFLVSTQE